MCEIVKIDNWKTEPVIPRTESLKEGLGTYQLWREDGPKKKKIEKTVYQIWQ